MTIRRLEQMMIKNTNNLRQIGCAGIAFTVLAFISGCATLEPQEEKIDVSAYSSLTTVDAVKKLETNLEQSKANELAVFAPKHYSTADKALLEARSLISKNEPREQVVQKVAVASAVLKNGDMVMRKVKDILEDQLNVKKKLDSLETKKVYRSEYGSLEERLNSIIREIENGDINNTEQNRGKLLQDLQKLERRSIRYNAMHEPEEILKRVKYRGGETLAPLTYNDALAVFQRAEQFIAQNPNYETGIEQIGQEALFAAKRALYITEQVSSLSQKVNISLEQVVLDEEYRMYRIARELDSVDLRDNPLEMQSEQLAKIAKGKAKEYQNKEGLITALRDTLIKVRDSSAELTALNDTSTRLKKEKDEWLAKEALYKAKVSHLENNLNQSQTQLDQTQQKLLSMKDENSQLFETLNLEKKNTQALQHQISQAAAKVEATSTVANQALVEQHPSSTEQSKDIEGVEKNSPEIKNADSSTEVAVSNETFDTTEEVKETVTISTKQPLTLIEDTTNKESIEKDIEISEPTEPSKLAETKMNEKSVPETQPNQKNPEKLVASTPSNDNKAKSQITEKETMDALKSVMDLINSKSQNSTNNSDEAIASKTDSKVFVDASE